MLIGDGTQACPKYANNEKAALLHVNTTKKKRKKIHKKEKKKQVCSMHIHLTRLRPVEFSMKFDTGRLIIYI